jgi:hypothetical protein
MQTTGTFPELSAGMKKSGKSRRNSGKFNKPDCGIGGGDVKTRIRAHNSAPKSFAGRRAASHAKAYAK